VPIVLLARGAERRRSTLKAAAQTVRAAVAVAAEHWTAHVDPGSGRAYYVDSVSKRSTWEQPEALAAAAVAAAAAATAAAAAAAATPALVRAPKAAGGGWEQRTDAQGRGYYVNKALGTSSWEKPAGFGA
jgi:hypothetical protein